MKPIAFSLGGLMTAMSLAVMAQDSGTLDENLVQTPDEPVVITDYAPDGDAPQIVIRPGADEVFYEYRVNGQIVEIKVVPEVGPEYYLVPADGGGWIRETESDMLVPSWVLFRW